MTGETDDELDVTLDMLGSVISVIVTIDDEEYTDSTAEVTIEKELALESVEGAAQSGNNNYNVLVAYFNQPIDDLAAGDIQIRRVSDDQLFAVESVSLSSDGLTATMTLANTGSAGAAVTGLRPNIDYNMIVNSDGEIASKKFSIPATYSEVTVSAVDPVKKTISVASNGGGTAATPAGRTVKDATLTIPDDLLVDYADILGRTVTVKYDKNKQATGIKYADEDIIYSAFKVTDKDGNSGNTHLQDVASKEVYEFEGVHYDGSIYQAIVQSNATAAAAWTAGTPAADTEYAYGKLVLNSNGTVRFFKGLTNVTNYGLVDSVVGDVAYCGTSEINLKNYTIIKDGETANIDDTEGNLVLTFAATKEAIIYTDLTTGPIDAVYAKSFEVDGRSFSYTSGATTASYIDGGKKDLTTDILNSYKSSGEDVEVYADFTGAPRIVIGTTGAAETQSIPLVLTRQPKIEEDGFDTYLAVEGFNTATKKIETYKINIADLTAFSKTSNAGVTTATAAADIKAGVKVVPANVAKAELTVGANVWADNDDLSSAADTYSAGSLLTLTQEVESKKITGLNLAASAALATVDGNAIDATTNAFKSGKKTINSKPVDPNAIVVTLSRSFTQAADAALAKDSVYTSGSKADYASYDGTVAMGARTVADATAAATDTRVYTNGDGKISLIVLFKDADKTGAGGTADRTANAGNDAAFTTPTTADTPFQAVVVNFKKGSGSGSNKTTDSLTVISANGLETYTKYSSSYSTPTFSNGAKGSVVIVTPVKDDAETVDSVTIVAENATNNTSPAAGIPVGSIKVLLDGTTNSWKASGAVVGGNEYKLLEDCLVVRMTANGAEQITWDDVNGDNTHYVYMHQANDTTRFVDVVILTVDQATTVTPAGIGTSAAKGNKTFTLIANAYTANTSIAMSDGTWDGAPDDGYIWNNQTAAASATMTKEGAITAQVTNLAGAPPATPVYATITFDNTGKIATISFGGTLATAESAVITFANGSTLTVTAG